VQILATPRFISLFPAFTGSEDFSAPFAVCLRPGAYFALLLKSRDIRRYFSPLFFISLSAISFVSLFEDRVQSLLCLSRSARRSPSRPRRFPSACFLLLPAVALFSTPFSCGKDCLLCPAAGGVIFVERQLALYPPPISETCPLPFLPPRESPLLFVATQPSPQSVAFAPCMNFLPSSLLSVPGKKNFSRWRPPLQRTAQAVPFFEKGGGDLLPPPSPQAKPLFPRRRRVLLHHKNILFFIVDHRLTLAYPVPEWV